LKNLDFRYLAREASRHPVAERVGFGGRFGVKLGVLWAEESSLPPISDGSKSFK